ncbi:hypothetical protein K2173_026950 [Erythroxylum novogranatense]|uniref:Bacterial Ig-like domain-containing protein n=1 Tax=Erythroxylum novogranatense TaxID=1862640 RepID=A0AAV8U078_9ROSI|nr:hypothetical protein K2173_026950 [Erythroxylum novogranatense]
MGSIKFLCLVLSCLIFQLLFFRAFSQDREFSVKFLKAPHAFSHRDTATFVFQVLVNGNVSTCTNCSISCKLDWGTASDCGVGKVLYGNLLDGNHAFEVCINRNKSCTTYDWTIDTVPPTAYITASSSFTNARNVSVNISFTETCPGGGGFACTSINTCNLLVYGAGEVIPYSLTILQPNLKYSLLVSLSPKVMYGRVVLVMDKGFCTDTAGNRFKRAANSSFHVHFDRRNVFVDLRIRIPEQLLQLNDGTRIVQATNHYKNLKVYLYFSEPILNSTVEVLNSLDISQGDLLPIDSGTLGNRRFGFQVANVSSIAVITVALHSNTIISRAGTSVSPIAPATFLFDSERPLVALSTISSTRTREHIIPVSVNFMKPVFGFKSSSLSISGGHLQSFREISRSKFIAEIQANDETISVNVPQNVTEDVSGNKNLASNVLQVRHYSIPMLSSVVAVLATTSFLATAFIAGLLTVSSASLLSVAAFSRPSSLPTSDTTRSLFRSACYIQIFALSRWLAITLPVEYYELARGLQWSIPYFSLPWETGGIDSIMVGSNSSISPHSFIANISNLGATQSIQKEEESLNIAVPIYGLPLTPMEYMTFFERQSIRPQAEFIMDPQHSNGWRDFDRSMFWLALIGLSLMLLHVLLLFVLKFKRRNSEKGRGYGALVFPRFEIYLVILALPCICKASAVVVRARTISGVAVGIILLTTVGLQLLSVLLFLSVGITLGKLLQYKEVHQEGQIFHWYQDIIRVTLGPGKRGQWTWKDQTKSVYLVMLGPLFEDLRGPPKYMLSQISGGNPTKQGDRIIASDDETEDAEAPFIQKLFGILRIYYTLLDLIKRVSLGIVAGAYLDDRSAKTPTIIVLCIISFQLFFLVLKKPFIKKKVQLVEIISLSCQVGVFASCVALWDTQLSSKDETRLGIFMVVVFLIGFMAHMINEWYALYRQTKQLDAAENSFLTGLKIASIGFLLVFAPQKISRNLENKLPRHGQGERETLAETSASTDRNRNSGSRSSGTPDKSWLRQLRELAKSSFTKEGSGTPNDPSTSHTKRSGFWTTKKSASSSHSSPSDSNPKPNQLYKDLEAIFASI